MENSPLAVGIIVAEACEGERRTVVLTVLVRVYEDIVVFHVLNVISRGIYGFAYYGGGLLSCGNKHCKVQPADAYLYSEHR